MTTPDAAAATPATCRHQVVETFWRDHVAVAWACSNCRLRFVPEANGQESLSRAIAGDRAAATPATAAGRALNDDHERVRHGYYCPYRLHRGDCDCSLVRHILAIEAARDAEVTRLREFAQFVLDWSRDCQPEQQPAFWGFAKIEEMACAALAPEAT